MNPAIVRFLKFGVVDTSGFLVDYSITWALVSLAVNFYISTGLGFCVAVVSNFLLNSFWTWGEVKAADWRVQFIKFALVSLIGLGIHFVVIWGVNAIDPSFVFSVGGYSISMLWIAKLCATGVVMVWNFLANNLYTFRSINSDE